MTAVPDALPYGVRDVKLTQYADAVGTTLSETAVDLPYTQHLNFTETEEFVDLRGDDKTVTTRGKGSTVKWDIESGGISTDCWAIFTGGSLIATGLTPNRIIEIQKKSTQSRPFFRIDGKIISDSGGDVLVRIYRCRANGDITANFADGAFTTSQIAGVGLPMLDDANDLIYSIFRRETTAAISLTPDPNPLGWPSNLTASNIATTSLTLNWTAVVGADHYAVEKAVSPFSTWTSAGTNPATNTLAVTGLTTGTTYEFRVSAVASTIQGDPCPHITVTTA
jgi:hypothetical protein